jgi:hypothetical protein
VVLEDMVDCLNKKTRQIRCPMIISDRVGAILRHRRGTCLVWYGRVAWFGRSLREIGALGSELMDTLLGILSSGLDWDGLQRWWDTYTPNNYMSRYRGVAFYDFSSASLSHIPPYFTLLSASFLWLYFHNSFCLSLHLPVISMSLSPS